MPHASARLTKRIAGGFTLIALAAASSAAFADHSPALDRVSIWLGGYYADNDTTLGASSKDGSIRGHANLEDDLGFSKHKTVPRARMDFLLGDSQGFSFDFYRIDRSKTKTLSDNINFLGDNYSAMARVKGDLKFDFGSADYHWWFGKENDVFGVGVGGAYFKVRTSLDASASLNDQSISGRTASSDSAWAPMLTLGWRHAFNDQWRMYADASGVKKNGGSLDGHIWNAALGVEYFPWQNVGIGAEYGLTRIKLNQSKRDYNADLDMRLDGPSLFLRLRF
jgi:hypothetical protein